ncbi:Dyp-type peroxidase [Gulosibacter hominis]|uniref:Dyp-type peroxidase n=1 Tax=Gulosibacter hominis TaxID=2770504 RepID=UPI00191AA065|nr:Dyp-type peroxidase [Gulosibacter hominis]
MSQSQATPPSGASGESSAESGVTRRGLSRRAFFALTGLGGVAAGAGAYAGFDALRAGGGSHGHDEDLSYDFYGTHQQGIATPMQDQMHFAAFDMNRRANRDDLVELLQDWTYAASRMVLGLDVTVAGAFDGGPYAPPDDTGEARGFGPHGLTITFGFGKSLFRSDAGDNRFGLASQLPKEFTELGPMANDFMDPARSDGDLCIQACANDPQVAVHAIRNLTRIAVGKATLRWSQLGFGRASSTSKEQETPRNLFGQKDGTNNVKAEDTAVMDEHIWIPADASVPALAGGTYLCARRINMTIEVWDGLRLEEQERVTGRAKGSGAPLSGGEEFTDPDFEARGDDGALLIDARSHVARVHPDNNDGIRMMRRAYNFVDGNDELGRLNAGLFFVAFVKEPERFAKVHRSMARDDMFVEYLKTTGSAVFVIPPGIRDGQFIGQQLFDAS